MFGAAVQLPPRKRDRAARAPEPFVWSESRPLRSALACTLADSIAQAAARKPRAHKAQRPRGAGRERKARLLPLPYASISVAGPGGSIRQDESAPIPYGTVRSLVGPDHRANVIGTRTSTRHGRSIRPAPHRPATADSSSGRMGEAGHIVGPTADGEPRSRCRSPLRHKARRRRDCSLERLQIGAAIGSHGQDGEKRAPAPPTARAQSSTAAWFG